MGIKERTTSILLLLFMMGGEGKNAVSLTSELLALFELPQNSKTRSTLRMLEKCGSITCLDKTSSTYELTDIGVRELSLSFPFARFTFFKWDGLWRIVSYEIPENKRKLRDTLRRKMTMWGLGPWHRSFWVTPHPILDELKAVIDDSATSEYAQAFEAKHILGDLSVLIDKVWKKQDLEREYRQLFKKWHMILSEEQSQNKKLQLIVMAYVGVLKTDPGLPKELLGDGWVGYESLNIFQEILKILYTQG